MTLLLALPAALCVLAPAPAASDAAREPVGARTSISPATAGASDTSIVASEVAPLAAPATCLAAGGGRLYIGRADGSVCVYDTASATGTVLKAPSVVGPVQSIAGRGDVVWWLAGDGALHRASLSGEVIIHTPVPGVVGGSSRLAMFHGVVWLLGASTVQAFDASVGTPLAPDRVLPDGCPRNGPISLCVSPDGSSATIWTSHVDRTGALSVTAWVSSLRSGWKLWLDRQTLANVASLEEASLAASPTRVAVVTLGGSVVLLDRDSDEARALAVPGGDIVDGVPRAASFGGSNLWWLQSGAVFRCDSGGQRTDAYLPWNVPGMRINALIADSTGAWVATSQGVRRIEPDTPPRGEAGYDGFVRMPLEEAAVTPPSPAASALSDAVSAWLGAPYVYGGASQTGTDCSGFVMSAFGEAGVPLPHGSDSLRTAAGGITIRDELRYGDILVYPGHCAIYLGNGMTAETVSGQRSVSISTIWRRRSVLVRRYLDVPQDRAVAASRHLSTPRRTRSRRHTSRSTHGQHQN